MSKKYSIGVDYGTLSGRAVLVDVKSGEIVSQAEKKYTHGVMDRCLPSGKKLAENWALQHPADYLEVLYETIPSVIAKSGVDKNDVIGISTDFTACTILPIDQFGTPLCMINRYSEEPHSYVKLWKHHAAQEQANRLNMIAAGRDESFLKRYGGKISSEWLVPKIMQIVEEAPEIYDSAYALMEAADWIPMKLCGKMVRNTCTAGYKSMWSKKHGYPDTEFFKALNPKMENIVAEKLKGELMPIGRRQGYLTDEMASRLGLTTNVAVAVGNVDAHVSLPAVGVTDEGKMLMIMGTSTCDILLGSEEKYVKGMCGVVEDGVIEGYFGYEAGQSCVGDHFDWFVNTLLKQDYFSKALEQNLDVHQYLTDKAAQLKPGQSGLIALDWWNGNRSILVDTDLTGMLLGMTLQTEPEEIYRALIEATAYGTRVIIESFEKSQVPIKELYACGGIAAKNSLMMQIYADVTNRPIRISACSQTPALGAAMFGAVAAGKAAGGYDSIVDCAKAIGKTDKVYYPIEKNVAIYDKLYAEYLTLHDYFGTGENNVMKHLKKIKSEVEGC
ncbi:ribulokinase [Clostridium omnivorum]|uniref:Ribulokinase n=1 Tax=Clostridium omnivorum TaxID=1604902 RepID=A0ABQ5N2D7_9CLOT|nr:ribulokinase [Clostridium sp. E14]GLC29230.1 ribulokinase [Clostridium sp. E14]